ncbi:hypothetical protein SUS17_486 [Sphingomonas sp. S17]|nr:hypothetical protein SUS17_486 [Sphingomonas sp. S17]
METGLPVPLVRIATTAARKCKGQDADSNGSRTKERHQ